MGRDDNMRCPPYKEDSDMRPRISLGGGYHLILFHELETPFHPHLMAFAQ